MSRKQGFDCKKPNWKAFRTRILSGQKQIRLLSETHLKIFINCLHFRSYSDADSLNFFNFFKLLPSKFIACNWWWCYCRPPPRETNESADCETASFWNCPPKCLFAVHHGNSLVYAFAEVSVELTMKQDSFYILYANFCPHKATNRFVLNRCLCRFESVWLMPISPMIMSWCLSWSICFLE